jgi:hypothetical protein
MGQLLSALSWVGRALLKLSTQVHSAPQANPAPWPKMERAADALASPISRLGRDELLLVLDFVLEDTFLELRWCCCQAMALAEVHLAASHRPSTALHCALPSPQEQQLGPLELQAGVQGLAGPAARHGVQSCATL